MRCRLLSVLIVVPILALSACDGSEDTETVEPVRTSSTSSASPTPTETPLPTTTPEAAKVAVSVLGSSVARTAEE
jgi:hypothetical protein